MSNTLLFEVLGERDRVVRVFLQEHHDLALFFGTYFSTMKALSLSVAESEEICNSFERSLAATMWQRALSYHLHALFHILARAPDSGLALLRSAVELARDFAIIARDAAALPIWENRAEGKDEAKQYRLKFQFDGAQNGQAAFRLYKFCCKYGVHGHMTEFAFSEIEQSKDNGRLIYFSPKNGIVGECLAPWLLGVPAINGLFIDALHIPRADGAVHQFYKPYLELVDELSIIMERIRALRVLSSD